MNISVPLLTCSTIHRSFVRSLARSLVRSFIPSFNTSLLQGPCTYRSMCIHVILPVLAGIQAAVSSDSADVSLSPPGLLIVFSLSSSCISSMDRVMHQANNAWLLQMSLSLQGNTISSPPAQTPLSLHITNITSHLLLTHFCLCRATLSSHCVHSYLCLCRATPSAHLLLKYLCLCATPTITSQLLLTHIPLVCVQGNNPGRLLLTHRPLVFAGQHIPVTEWSSQQWGRGCQQQACQR